MLEFGLLEFGLLEFAYPIRVKYGIEVWCTAVRAHQQHLGAPGLTHPRCVSLDCGVGRPAGAPYEQSMGHEKLAACIHGLPLGYQYHVVDESKRQQRWNDARPNPGN